MELFTYHEHKENVALALAVCTHLGVDRAAALQGMAHCLPDVGALRAVELVRGSRSLQFINAMAANDPQSTHQLYRDMVDSQPASWQRIVVVNTRRDRPIRSRQMAGLLARLKADDCFVLGDGAASFKRNARDEGIPANRLSIAADYAMPELVGAMLDRAKPRGIVFAMAISPDLASSWPTISVRRVS
jgi:poly-gamma-glutamate synthase PgsB/CapB